MGRSGFGVESRLHCCRPDHREPSQARHALTVAIIGLTSVHVKFMRALAREPRFGQSSISTRATRWCSGLVTEVRPVPHQDDLSALPQRLANPPEVAIRSGRMRTLGAAAKAGTHRNPTLGPPRNS